MISTIDSSRADLFNRILRADDQSDVDGLKTLPINTDNMITKVTVRPNPFNSILTLDVSCESNRNIIVRMFNTEGRIVKMFSWYLVKGTNITAINDLTTLEIGLFHLDFVNNDGTVLYSTRITKE